MLTPSVDLQISASDLEDRFDLDEVLMNFPEGSYEDIQHVQSLRDALRDLTCKDEVAKMIFALQSEYDADEDEQLLSEVENDNLVRLLDAANTKYMTL
jgi:hypothetical protein